MGHVGADLGGRPKPLALVLAVTGIAVALVVGIAAVAGPAQRGPAIWRQDDGSVAIDGSRLRPAYHGGYVTMGQIADLQRRGLAMGSVNSRELACQGISLYFDTEAERQAYLDDFERRDQGRPVLLPPHTDPCERYASSPRYVTTG